MEQLQLVRRRGLRETWIVIAPWWSPLLCELTLITDEPLFYSGYVTRKPGHDPSIAGASGCTQEI